MTVDRSSPSKEAELKIRPINPILYRWVPVALAMSLFSISASATDLTLYGGTQNMGNFNFETAESNTSDFIGSFDPKTFGVFGIRIGHGKVIGGEHTFAYAPNFVNSDSHAFIYHSNLRIQLPITFLRPYATGGLGLIDSSGSPITSFGAEFAFNYGGGVNLTFGPLGVNFDVRGYTIPSVHLSGFVIQDNLNLVQVSAGVVFVIK